MTHAELLRNHADLAVKEGGMYYSGEYLSRIAETAESLEAENAKLREQVDAAHMSRLLTENENESLRELVRIAGTYCVNGLCGKDDGCPLYLGKPYCALHDRMRELGIEVN